MCNNHFPKPPIRKFATISSNQDPSQNSYDRYTQLGYKHTVFADCIHSGNPVEMFSVEKQKQNFILASGDNLIDTANNAMLVESTQWLPFFSEAYNISSKLEDYVVVPVIIMPSDLPNRNAAAFPYEELAKANPELGLLNYQTWRAKPSFADHCFPEETMITMGDGTKKFISNIEVGDMVLTHKANIRSVTEVFKNGEKSLSEIKCQGLIDSIFVTSNHPFLVALNGPSNVNEQVFKPVRELEKGDYLLAPVNKYGDAYYIPVKILSITHNVRIAETYNFEVEEDHSYVANDLAVHNCNKDHTKAKGIIFSSVMRPIHNVYGDLWKVICLVGFDRTNDPALVNDILNGKHGAYSMGAWTTHFTCSVCGAVHNNPNTPGCEHVRIGNPTLGNFNGKLAYLDSRNPTGFEVSVVTNSPPAYESARTQKDHVIKMWDN